MVTQRYEISNEYNVTEMLERFDSNYIFDIINDKLDNIDYTAVLPDSNVIISFEENFKAMNDNYPGDSANIKEIRNQVYLDIINILCERFNLYFNDVDGIVFCTKNPIPILDKLKDINADVEKAPKVEEPNTAAEAEKEAKKLLK